MSLCKIDEVAYWRCLQCQVSPDLGRLAILNVKEAGKQSWSEGGGVRSIAEAVGGEVGALPRSTTLVSPS